MSRKYNIQFTESNTGATFSGVMTVVRDGKPGYTNNITYIYEKSDLTVTNLLYSGGSASGTTSTYCIPGDPEYKYWETNEYEIYTSYDFYNTPYNNIYDDRYYTTFSHNGTLMNSLGSTIDTYYASRLKSPIEDLRYWLRSDGISVCDFRNPTVIAYGYISVDFTNFSITPVGDSFNTPINDVCFPSFTPVHTNLGVVNIEDVNIGIHKINNKKILCVTKTIGQDKHLVLIPKNSLGKNYPCKTTIMTKRHKLFYRGKFIEAFYLINKCVGVKYIPYKGDILYNIVLENHSVMNINNLICETLHPNNPIAKLYLNVINNEDKNNIISEMNYSIVHKDIQAYKKIVSKL